MCCLSIMSHDAVLHPLPRPLATFTSINHSTAARIHSFVCYVRTTSHFHRWQLAYTWLFHNANITMHVKRTQSSLTLAVFTQLLYVQCASVSGTTQQMLKNTTNYAMNCARYFTETTKLHITSQRNQLGSRAFQFANWIRYANQFVL